jgi:antitoxin component of MazEF toxin-antitoxin module
VELRAQDGELVLTPQRVQDPELEKLIGAITAKNRHTETDWGSAVGGEAW